MLESQLQKKCAKLAKKNNVLVRKIHCENSKGFMDLLLIFPITGKVVFVEMKNPNGKGKLSKLQEREIDKVRAQGASVYVCESYSRFTSILTIHCSKNLVGKEED